MSSEPRGGAGDAGAAGVPAPVSGGAGAPGPGFDPAAEQSSGAERAVDPAETLAEAVRAVPGVADLHGGTFGEVATYLPGRRVAGISLGPDRAAVHVSVAYGADVHEVVTAVRSAASEHVSTAIDVHVEDVAAPTG